MYCLICHAFWDADIYSSDSLFVLQEEPPVKKKKTDTLGDWIGQFNVFVTITAVAQQIRLNLFQSNNRVRFLHRFEAQTILSSPRWITSLRCVIEYLATGSGGNAGPNMLYTVIVAWLKYCWNEQAVEGGVKC